MTVHCDKRTHAHTNKVFISPFGRQISRNFFFGGSIAKCTPGVRGAQMDVTLASSRLTYGPGSGPIV